MAEGNNDAIIERMVQVVITLFTAGNFYWLWAWILLGISILAMTVNSRVLPKELISERGNPKNNVKKWDRVITLISIFPVFFIYIISGLDQRWNWTGSVPIWVNLLGIILMIIGQLFFTWAMLSNRFFSTMVRIQDDRGHMVATTGPYRIIRHPGYIGFILQNLSTSLILGSTWGLVPAGIVAVLFVIRTAYEDSTLKQELSGYQEYANKVRYRLVPGIW
jgi:protein-S-isoprenylcysteine O-methyltransferase Ste14